jgi:hypothetical protein
MELPPVTSVEGAYWYLIGIIIVLALVSGVYLVGAILGYLPDPTGLVGIVGVDPL